MPGTPQWKKVLISGSNLEVYSLTSSVDLGILDEANNSKSIVFRDPTTGGWQVDSNIVFENTYGSTYLINVGNNGGEHAVNVPDLPITASVVGQPIPYSEEGVYQYPALFKNSTYGGFERTSSVFYEGFLGWDGFQRTTNNAYIVSGSKLEDGNNRVTALFPDAVPPILYPPFALTFTESFSTQTTSTYLDTDIGDYIQWNLGLPVGAGITASFNIPVVFTGSYAGDREFIVTLRRWLPGGYSLSTPDYLDTSITLELQNIIPIDNPQWGSIPATGSASGSFEIDSTISQAIASGERWQLRVDSGTDSGWMIGYLNSYTSDIGPFEFIITGSTAPAVDIFGGDLSGSFVGDVYGGYSGSLSGVTLNSIGPDKALVRGNGIIFVENDGSSLTNFVGDAETTMSIRLYPMGVQGIGAKNKSGLSLEFVGDSTLFSGFFEPGSTAGGLELTDGLAQGGTFGLEFNGSNKEQIGIQIDSGQLGINVISDQLRLTDAFTSNGIAGTFGSGGTGTASIDLAPNSGLSLSGLVGGDGKLQLSSSLPGNGLYYRNFNDNTIIDLDPSYAVTSSGFINFNTVLSQGTLAVSQTGTPTTSTQVDVKYNNTSPDNVGIMGFRQGNTFPNSRTITGSVLVAGNLTVISSSNISSIWAADFQTTDPFIELNSGSATTYPFSRDNGGLIIQTSSDAGNTNAKGAAVYYSRALGTNDPLFSEIGWGVTKGGVEWDEKDIFSGNIYTATGSTDNGFLSQVRIKTNNTPEANNTYLRDLSAIDSLGTWYIDRDKDPAGSDSNVWLFVIDQ